MPDLTTNLGIKKPLGNEVVSRASFNENWDIIDANAAKQSDLTSHIGSGGASHAAATPTQAGFMPATDKDAMQSLNKYRSGLDSATGIYTTIDYKRKDGTLFCNSVLSSKDTNGNYITCTNKYYGTDGTILLRTETVTISYDANAMPINEVLS